MEIPQRLSSSYISEKLYSFLLEHNLYPFEMGCVPLEMTESGWGIAQQHCPREKGVYIHLTECGIPLRIGVGLGAQGIYGRWFHSLACHKYSFLQRPLQPLNYRTFFQQISEHYQQTYLGFLLMDPSLAESTEKKLCEEFLPVWEIQNHQGTKVWKNGTAFATNQPVLEETILLRKSEVKEKYRQI